MFMTKSKLALMAATMLVAIAVVPAGAASALEVARTGTQEDLADFLLIVAKAGVLEYDCSAPAESSPDIVGRLLASNMIDYGVMERFYDRDPRGWLDKDVRWYTSCCAKEASDFERVAEGVYNLDPGYLKSIRDAGRMEADGSWWWYYSDGMYFFGSNAKPGSSPTLDITVQPWYGVELLSVEPRDDGAYDVEYDYQTNAPNASRLRRYAVVELGDSMKGVTVDISNRSKVVSWERSWELLKSSASPITEEQASRRHMYRLYNQWTGEHFYTSDTDEKQSAQNAGWTYEGVGWDAPTKSNTPVYRLYNPYVEGGDHHYTTDAAERDKLVPLGWRDEGVGWYSDDAKAVPLYRQYNPFAATGTHNYTKDKAENDNLVEVGWRAEGVGWYGV